MEKARRPHVVRTWTVERTKVPYRPPQPKNFRPDPHEEIFHRTTKPPHGTDRGVGH